MFVDYPLHGQEGEGSFEKAQEKDDDKPVPGPFILGIMPGALEVPEAYLPVDMPPGTLYLPAELLPDRVLLADDEPRHNGGRNCLYYDGHVKWLRGDEALSLGVTRGDLLEVGDKSL